MTLSQNRHRVMQPLHRDRRASILISSIFPAIGTVTPISYWVYKFHIFWEGHKNLNKSSTFFDVFPKQSGIVFQIMWPSYNI